MIRRTPRSTLLPYTTLIRSKPNNKQEIISNNTLSINNSTISKNSIKEIPQKDEEEKIDNEDLIQIIVEYPTTEKEIIEDRKSTRLNSSHANISYAVFCLKKK